MPRTLEGGGSPNRARTCDTAVMEVNTRLALVSHLSFDKYALLMLIYHSRVLCQLSYRGILKSFSFFLHIYYIIFFKKSQKRFFELVHNLVSMNEKWNETEEKNSLVICRPLGLMIPSTPVSNNYHKIISFLYLTYIL